MAKRDWLAFDYKSYAVTTSVSAIEAFRTCQRKWWMKKVHRLPEPPFQAGVLGDAFHELCELYLLGNDDPAKTESWRKDLSTSDIDILSRALRVMIDKQVLQRQPGLEVEKAFQIRVTPKASIMGFCDAIGAGTVQDHKTSKTSKYFATPAKLAADFAMLTYAYVELQRDPSLKSVKLRHNQVTLDAKCPTAAITEVDVPADRIRKHWEIEVVPIATKMVVLKGQRAAADQWAKIQGTEGEHQCHAYGRPCEYYDICHGNLSPSDYIARAKAEGI
jgi:hypothetical protein